KVGSAQLLAQFAEEPESFGKGVVLVDRLFVDLTGKDERLVAEIAIDVEGAKKNSADDVFDEPRIVMRLVDDEELVGAFEEIVRLTRHRVFHDLYEIFGGNRLRRPAAEQNRPSPALVVRRNRQRVEGSPRVGLAESG